MSIQQRIDRLQKVIDEATEQRNWLKSVEWADDHSTTEQAVEAQDRVIATHQNLIEKLSQQE